MIENKNQVIDTISNVIEEADTTEDSMNAHVKELKMHLLRDNIMDKNLEDFRLYFERVHADFFKNLHQAFPSRFFNSSIQHQRNRRDIEYHTQLRSKE